jgi:hypothetical protein
MSFNFKVLIHKETGENVRIWYDEELGSYKIRHDQDFTPLVFDCNDTIEILESNLVCNLSDYTLAPIIINFL